MKINGGVSFFAALGEDGMFVSALVGLASIPLVANLLAHANPFYEASGGLILLAAISWLFLAPAVVVFTVCRYFSIISQSIILNGENIVIKKGVFERIETTIPLRNVVDVCVHQSIYERFFGVASLILSTPGKELNMTTALIGLKKSKVDSIKGEILAGVSRL
jgi:uncharacterized membrane protein YdbT with pleckstrin-like domain